MRKVLHIYGVQVYQAGAGAKKARISLLRVKLKYDKPSQSA